MSTSGGFASTIKPYFNPCYRAHMMKYGDQFDLWDASQVESEWDNINNQVGSGTMPAPGCPEGTWDSMVQAQFLKDFLAWKNAGYPP